MIRLTAFRRDERGVSAVEYAMLLALVGGAVATAAYFLGGAISGAMYAAAGCMAAPDSTTCA
jgi:pilus assembly protein Flp/PilA